MLERVQNLKSGDVFRVLDTGRLDTVAVVQRGPYSVSIFNRGGTRIYVMDNDTEVEVI